MSALLALSGCMYDTTLGNVAGDGNGPEWPLVIMAVAAKAQGPNQDGLLGMMRMRRRSVYLPGSRGRGP